ncbi:MAG: flagellar protein [Lachnospiraceae bacterium]|nr:flagellar protein [Lachnospiraceae bacterium]
MNVETGSFRSALQIQSEFLTQSASKKEKPSQQTGVSFQDIFVKKVESDGTRAEELKFSKHASSRLLDRNISLSDNQVERLNEGAKKALDKGISESLVLVDDLAFIVNVKSSTVITAMDQTETNENVFTNIDGAVIM